MKSQSGTHLEVSYCYNVDKAACNLMFLRLLVHLYKMVPFPPFVSDSGCFTPVPPSAMYNVDKIKRLE